MQFWLFSAGQSTAFCQAFAVSQDFAPNRAALTAYNVELRQAWIRRHPNAPVPAGNPLITTGSITTPIVFARNPPAAPGLSFSFTAGPTGMAYALFYFTGPGGQIITVGYSSIDAPTSGSFTILSPGMSLNEYHHQHRHINGGDEFFL